MKRTIVYICNRSGRTDQEGSIIALANDGTLWEGYPHWVANGKPYEFKWTELPSLPDDNANLGKVR